MALFGSKKDGERFLARNRAAHILVNTQDEVIDAVLDSIVEEYWDCRREGLSGDDAFKEAIKSHRRQSK